MAWMNIKVEDQREYLVKSYLSKTATMSDLSAECGISRKTGYKWVNRYLKEGTDGLSDKKRIPLTPCKLYSEEQITKALELKNQQLFQEDLRDLSQIQEINQVELLGELVHSSNSR